MPSINLILLMGHLGKNPELKFTQTQKPFCKFSLATSEKRGDNEETIWHNIVLWGKAAEIADKYLTKGDLVWIEGTQRNRTYEKDGETKYTSEVSAYKMTMIKTKGKESGEPETEDDISGIF